MRRGAASVCLLAAAACGNAGPPGTAAAADGAPTLAALIGTAPCASDDQCRTLAIGERACGGTEHYLAWSILQSEPGALQAAAVRETRGPAKAAAGGDSLLSTCQVVADPGAYCALPEALTVNSGPTARAAGANGVCRLRPAVAGGSASMR